MKTEEAVKRYGSKYRLAQLLGITRQAVGQWGEEVPAHRAAQIREAIRAKIGQLEEMVK